MDALVASGVPKERICYFDFEDDRLSPVTPETGDRVLETFRYLYPDEENSQGIYLFFDELQEMKGWGAWLRRVLNANVVGFGGKICGEFLMADTMLAFLKAEYEATPEHDALVAKLDAINQADPEAQADPHFFDEFIEKWAPWRVPRLACARYSRDHLASVMGMRPSRSGPSARAPPFTK